MDNRENNEENVKRLEEELKLVAEVTEIEGKSILLCKDARFNMEQIMKWAVEKRKKDKEVYSYTPEENNQIIHQANVLLTRLKISIKQATALDIEYNNLRERVNKFYGSDVLKAHPPLPNWDNIIKHIEKLKEDGLSGDEWKTSS